MKGNDLIISILTSILLSPPPIQGSELIDLADTLIRYLDNIPNEEIGRGFVDFIEEFLDNESDGCAMIASTFLKGFQDYTDPRFFREVPKKEPEAWIKLQKFSLKSFEKLPKTIYCNEASEVFMHYRSENIDTAIFKAGLSYLDRLVKDPCTSAFRTFLSTMADHNEIYDALHMAILTYTAEEKLIFNPDSCKGPVDNFIQKHGKELRNIFGRNEL